jgi:hypothetical protein
MWQKSRSYSSASSSSSNLPGTLLDQDPELRLQLHFSSDLARKGKLMLLVLVLVLVLVECIHHIVSQNTASRIGGKKKKGKKLSGSSPSLTLKEEFQLLVFLLPYPTSPLTSLS